MEREQIAIRLTIRLPDKLEELIRAEAARRGTNVNQTMLHILNFHFQNQKDL